MYTIHVPNSHPNFLCFHPPQRFPKLRSQFATHIPFVPTVCDAYNFNFLFLLLLISFLLPKPSKSSNSSIIKHFKIMLNRIRSTGSSASNLKILTISPKLVLYIYLKALQISSVSIFERRLWPVLFGLDFLKL